MSPLSPTKPKRTFSIARDGDDGYGVQDEDGCFVNIEPFETERRAQLFMDELEERELAEAEERRAAA